MRPWLRPLHQRTAALEWFDALSDREIQAQIKGSYDLVVAKLTRAQQHAIAARPGRA